MTSRSRLAAVALVLAALATAVAVAAVTYVGSRDGEGVAAPTPGAVDPARAVPGTGLPEEGIRAEGVVEPRIILFGDTIRAHVDLLLDGRRVDPTSVRVSTEFVPWEIVGPQTRVRRDAGATTYIRTSFTLRCTSSPCLPANQSSALEFNAARVSYRPAGNGQRGRRSVSVDFPILVVYSRFAAANADGPAASSSIPWRADLDSLPATTYRIPPTALLAVLLVLAGLLAAAGAVLAYVAAPRRAPQPEPEPEPEPVPIIVLTPLEQALELLEDASRADGVEDRRRALELVAEVLDLEHPHLARAARSLAWSEDDPLVEQTSGLATRVRATIDLAANGSGNGNGRAHS